MTDTGTPDVVDAPEAKRMLRDATGCSDYAAGAFMADDSFPDPHHVLPLQRNPKRWRREAVENFISKVVGSA